MARLLLAIFICASFAVSECAPTKSKTKLDVSDPTVLAASEFAMSELRKYCDYCNDELKETYQNLKLQSLQSASSQPTSLSDGTMYFLDMTLETDKPYDGKCTDSQTVIVFQNKDGSYNGMSVERSPFLEH
mmetsp:Transcript_7790/g.14721  ORF Transcript_7790/g.14721 Transcript_7790/m.14721 type:complete len:131 (-) Transcript_7790:385-777(-)|eukprot:CAMPEP_0114235296 /NCGR_PEP_ID=MMETSP0058-20121206/6173_1 /TAXON_ID=36894 /ORGANISM="Pyramimonas parkeae, CCMP726" /LENGTH=130 /DNA_ID=CAMNT_0001347045 /DNA_START=117 /DNA_END=509 /DNA_ORIENTATION=-